MDTVPPRKSTNKGQPSEAVPVAKQIIILEKKGPDTWEYVMWAVVPVAYQPFYANPTATSRYTGTTAQELQDIRDGKVYEHFDMTNYQPGLSEAQIRTRLVSRFADLQSQITNRNPWTKYGSFYDGTTWTPGGVA